MHRLHRRNELFSPKIFGRRILDSHEIPLRRRRKGGGQLRQDYKIQEFSQRKNEKHTAYHNGGNDSLRQDLLRTFSRTSHQRAFTICSRNREHLQSEFIRAFFARQHQYAP